LHAYSFTSHNYLNSYPVKAKLAVEQTLEWNNFVINIYCRKLGATIPGALCLGGVVLSSASGNDLLERMCWSGRLWIDG